MEHEYFTGQEFDWLRGQVTRVLWDPIRSGAATAESQPWPLWRPSARPAAMLMRELWDRAPKKPAAVLPLEMPPVGSSVSEYNRWRGEKPGRAERFPYIFQQYPMTLYRKAERLRVTSEKEHSKAIASGWQEFPTPEIRDAHI